MKPIPYACELVDGVPVQTVVFDSHVSALDWAVRRAVEHFNDYPDDELWIDEAEIRSRLEQYCVVQDSNDWGVVRGLAEHQLG